MSAHTPVRGVPDAPLFSSCDGCRQLIVHFCPLHAAAPALLEALEALVAWNELNVPYNHKAVAKAQAAIRAAKGIPGETAPLTMETYEGFKGSD